MVRETRHLWVGNLPDNIREDRIREHFKRYGRVQNVKLLGRAEAPGSSLGASVGTVVALGAAGGVSATVAFMDIKSAAKAHNAEHILEDRTLTTEYYEPAAIPSTTGAPSAGSSPAGSGYSGSSSSVNSAAAPAPANTAATTAAATAAATVAAARYHLTEAEGAGGCTAALVAAAPANWRGTNDSASEYCRRGNTPSTYGRYSRTGSTAPYATPPSNVERTPHHRWYGSGSGGGGESTPSTPGGAGDGSGRRRRRSGSGGASHSSRSSSTSREPSSDSRSSTPTITVAAGGITASPATPGASMPTAAHHNHRTSQGHQWASTASGRPLAICVRNLPTRSSDSSLKDGLYHEYKKHGKVVWVKVVGQNADRYAVVRFKKPSDVEKALEVSQDKLFFGCKISVAPHQSCDEDAESAKPYETDIDEFHPKATRTLFIGNLEKDVTQQQLREKFKHFGRIIEIDIKKGSGGGSGYAFCQYASIASVVEAIRAMDGEYVGGSRVKLGFGKPVATACVWIDGLTEHTEKQVVSAVSRCGTATSVCVDRAAGAALVHFEQAAAASTAVRELRRLAAQVSSDPDQRRLMVDYASRECQEAFYEQLEKHGGSAALAGSERLGADLTTRYIPSTRHEPLRYDGCGPRSRASSYGRSSSRTPRYTAMEHYDPADYAADRRYRVFDDLGSSPQIEDAPYEERLQSVVVSPHRARRHRRDSTPDEHKHSKERHRSSGIRRSSGEIRHRSRSGSISEHRRRGSDTDRRRHRRRRDESGSRAGTPLCDELPEGPAPAEPRRPPLPRDRSHLPMSLPLPKFAAQVLRSVASHAPPPAPTTAPASPPRPPSASSSSESSAPHSPSLEERIRSLDEKYEKWSGSRLAAAEAAERGRFKHRLLEIDINEVKPSEVVRSLLAKRSVFDEDSERLEGTVLQRPPSPGGSPRSRTAPRALQYPFPTHPPTAPTTPSDGVPDIEERVPPNGFSSKILRDRLFETISDCKKNLDSLDSSVANLENRINSKSITGLDPLLDDPRLNRHDRLFHIERGIKSVDFDNKQDKLDVEVSLRSSLINKLHESSDKYSQKTPDHAEIDRDPRIEAERKRREFYNKDNDRKVHEIEWSEDKCHKSNRLFPDLYKIDKHLSESVESTLTKNECVENTLEILYGEKKIISKDNVSCNSPKHPEVNDSQESLDELQSFKTTIKIEKHSKSELELDILEKLSKECESAIKDEKQNTFCMISEDAKISKFFTPSMVTVDKTVNIACKEKELSSINKEESNDFEKIVEPSHILLDAKSQNLQEHGFSGKIEPAFEKIEKQDDTSVENEKSHHLNKTQIHLDNVKTEIVKPENLGCVKQECDENQTIRQFSDYKSIPDQERKEHDSRRNPKEKHDSDKVNKDNLKVLKIDKPGDKNEKEKRIKEDPEKEKVTPKLEKEKFDKENRSEKETEKIQKDRNDKETDKTKNVDDKSTKNDHRKDKDKERKRDHVESNELNMSRSKKEDHRHKHDRHRKEHSETKRDNKKDSESKSRKSSRDENNRELCRKDSTDSSASRTSHDSAKMKEGDASDIKEDAKIKIKIPQDNLQKHKLEKVSKCADIMKSDDNGKTKREAKEDREEHFPKNKTEITEKQRHYSVDSLNLESKRKERLNSCSSLPSNIGYKRRMSSQDSIDSLIEESKKCKIPERRDSKESRFNDKHKTAKFNKCHFAKLLESKTKEDKKSQVKPPDESQWKDNESKDFKLLTEKTIKRGPKESEEKLNTDSKGHCENRPEELQNDIDFLATLELRSSEEDEKQKALRKEMKEKKRIQQLQQIQELQMQQDALQQTDILNKTKDDKKLKSEDKKKDAAREKRMSTERKSREDKLENKKNKCRKQFHSSDTSDSDEPKKHSIFDIVDDEPTYISMYDKVKARSCKNMQKQEEEKRQEKIKAKFCQLKQSRAKREEKKRSSWDEDSDSDHDRKKPSKMSVASSSEDERSMGQNKKHDKSITASNEFDHVKNDDKQHNFSTPHTDDDCKNKLSRKNFRTRIMSDTSDDELLKTCMNKNMVYRNDMKKELTSDTDISVVRLRDCDIHSKYIQEDICNKNHESEKHRRNIIMSLFQSKANHDLKVKDNLTDTDYDCKTNLKMPCNELSSENESIVSSKFSIDIHRKHKKKQKKAKISLSEDDIKTEILDYIIGETETKHKHSDKTRKHNSKKDKRKDKSRESTELDESKDDKLKLKKNRNCQNTIFENRQEFLMSSIKKEGKMEDIFGPLSDESDSGARAILENQKNSPVAHDFTCNVSCVINDCDETTKDKDEFKRKKEKKKRDKRYVIKDDDNSLDVDAAGKAIEAQLFAEAAQDNIDQIEECETDHDENIYKYVENARNSIDKHSEKQKREYKEKKKKKKRNKEDRQCRKDFHHQFNEKEKLESPVLSIELQKNQEVVAINDLRFSISTVKPDNHTVKESPSLPRLTDSPPTSKSDESVNENCTSTVESKKDHKQGVAVDLNNKESSNDKKVLVPAADNTSLISVGSLSDCVTESEKNQGDGSMPVFENDIDQKRSENAVRSISEFDKPAETAADKISVLSHNTSIAIDEKVDEKPRAVISQEETEDAVAALLGESFGGKDSTFGNRYNNVNEQPADQIETTGPESENILEEDAEEMRQAVQNLNASEMESKPDTPLSDNDLLLIDTDNEGDESQQDAIDRLPVNIIATNPSLTSGSDQVKCSENTIVFSKAKQITTVVHGVVSDERNASSAKSEDINPKYIALKRDHLQQITSTATPVITSWTLSNNKMRESHLRSAQDSHQIHREINESKSVQINSSVVHLKTTPTHSFSMANSTRSIISPPNRLNAPYQVINPIIRPTQVTNMQAPTIKIPEPHLLYHKQQGIVISPRLASDTKLQSPKGNAQLDSITSPRLTNMTILSTPPTNINSVSLTSANTVQQRPPGHLTVVRMQQPPLSPIQTMHIPQSARTMVSPNRPSSVLVQTQTTPIHFNRIPVTPVLAPLSKQLSSTLVQSKAGNNAVVPIMQSQKLNPTDCRKNEQRIINGPENVTEHSKIILSPTSLQQSTNHTVMAQNRLLSMQNAVHSGLHLPNKVVINNIAQLNETREKINATFKSEIPKSEGTVQNHPYSQSPIIHVTGLNQTNATIIHNGPKHLGVNQETATRAHIIHTINPQRLLTTAPITSAILIDANKCSPSVLSMANIRPQTVLTKFEPPNATSFTTTAMTNSVMTPILTKTISTPTIKQNVITDIEVKETFSPSVNKHDFREFNEVKENVKTENIITTTYDPVSKKEPSKTAMSDNISKCETDFEELLKDNTNEIKITNNPDKKLEVNVGKIVTLISTNPQCRDEILPTKDIAVQNTSFHKSSKINNGKEKDSIDNKIPTTSDGKTVDKPVLEEKICEMDSELKAELLINTSLEDNSTLNNNETVKIAENIKSSNLIGSSDKPLDSDVIESDDSKNLLEDNTSWSAKDINMESVIKKIDSLCKETKDNTTDEYVHNNIASHEIAKTLAKAEGNDSDFLNKLSNNQSTEIQKTNSISKRGRGLRGKKSERYRDRVQTRQISKPARGSTVSKRGRGRGRLDKKLKTFVGASASNLPGDVYDFHEDSGDESKTESRPRLILTIKSPLSGQSNIIATSSLSITSKEQKSPEKTLLNKEEKNDEFVSPSLNTRKSRRLQEKDVQRNTVDDVIEDVIKNSTIQTKGVKEVNKRRPTRQAGHKVNYREKNSNADVRKSPRGTKRTRNRSSSEASLDSSDERTIKKEDSCSDAKLPKLVESVAVVPKSEPEPQNVKPSNTPVINSLPATTPTPIMKPPKKMISEISAKLASAFESTTSTPVHNAISPNVVEKQMEESSGLTKIPLEPDKQPYRDYFKNQDCVKVLPNAEEILQAATAEAPTESHTVDMGFGRRLVDGVPGNVMPVGAMEAADARVQSPALPHRPPSVHRPADRATPILIRAGEGEMSVAGAGAGPGVVAGAAAGSRAYRAPYAATASLPRGAHHPPPPPQAPLVAHPHHPLHPAHKQIPVIGAHPHAGARVTITSVPSVSPKSQMPLGDGVYPHFSHQHYQMFQKQFRVTLQENRATASPYTRSPMEAEGPEAPTPPLELRRPVSARVPRPAHSPSPADRLISNHGGRSPPPAHGGAVAVRLPSALPPHGPPGPMHASQVPREADSLQMLLRRYPVMWQGLLALKNDCAAVQMHFVHGNPNVAGSTLPRLVDGSTPPLRIAQRMRLEPAQLEQVHRKMKMENEHCMLLALPCGRDHMDVLQQSNNLTAGFITYLQRKQAAGIVNVAPPGHQQAMYTVHIFPSCDFANENLNRIAPDLMHRVADIAHLLIVIATV